MSKNTWKKLLLIDFFSYLATILSFFLLIIKVISYQIVICLAISTIVLFIILIKNEAAMPFREEDDSITETNEHGESKDNSK